MRFPIQHHSRLLNEWADNSTTTNATYLIVVILLVIGSGLMSGLTLGLLSLDHIEMEVLRRSGTPTQKKLATKIMPVISDTHWLLVTLLLCNAACMEALPIFLDTLLGPWQAIIVSITAILIFGEIVPQSICARHGLAIGAFLAPGVRFLTWFTSPISWPIARLLDFVLGSEKLTLFRRKELRALVDMHGEDEGLGGKLSEDEVTIICGALDLTHKVAYLGMTPLAKVFMLEANSVLNKDLLRSVLESGHSRIPVYQGDRTNIVGLILTKDLLNYSLDEEVPIHCMKMRHLPTLKATTPMYDMLKLFQTGRSHMAVLTQPEVPEAVANLALKADRKRTKDAAGLDVSVHGPTPLKDGAAAIKDKGIGGLSPVPEVYMKKSLEVSTEVDRNSSPYLALEVGEEKDVGENGATPEKKQKSSVFRRLSNVLTPIAKKADDEDEEEKVDHEGGDVPEMTVVPQIAKPGEVIGIITIEDVLEELMGREILDETDRFADNEQTVSVNDAVKGAMMKDLDSSLRAHLAVTGQLVKMSAVRRSRQLSRYTEGESRSSNAGDVSSSGVTPTLAGSSPHESQKDLPSLNHSRSINL